MRTMTWCVVRRMLRRHPVSPPLYCDASLRSFSTTAHTQATQYQDFTKQHDGSLYEGHRPTTFAQRLVLTAGASLLALRDPTRVDLVAALGETTGRSALERMRLRMLNDRMGQRILHEKPIIDRETTRFDSLSQLPADSFGRAYHDFMSKNEISSEGRDAVHFVDNAELAYVMKRYRQIHDFIHVLTGVPTTSVPGELAVKIFEASHFGLPMPALAAVFGHLAVFGPLAVTPQQRKKLASVAPWAIATGLRAEFLLNVYFEHEFETNLGALRRRLHIDTIPIGL